MPDRKQQQNDPRRQEAGPQKRQNSQNAPDRGQKQKPGQKREPQENPRERR